jgi:3-hydroxyacyl-[acyl-carrier-protein] dehydratase
MITQKEIRRILPFEGPLRLVDKIVKYDETKEIVSIKRVNKKESFFKGHFPGYPVMPGHLMAEAIAQTCALFFSRQYYSGKRTAYFLASSKVRFLGQVRPGDTLIIKAQPVKMVSFAGIFKGEARVRNKIVAKGEFGIAAKEL